ncbi:chromosome partitioning protein ParA [Vibrio kasasachensis]|uniref:chromosome partitioning protein ParA n=1 Tax=Vibrio kasasachensis TaxID=2910248 RepID=UPI003D0F48EC
MNKLCLVFILLLAGCKTSSEDKTSSPPPSPIAPVVIEKTPELIQELKAQPTIDDQFGVIYENFEHLLDRSESLTGPDGNNNGIRDDIEAFIDALEITEPVRNVLKQNAHYQQENLNYDFSDKSDANARIALEISRKYDKVIACKAFLGISVDDIIDTSRTIVALTYNTKARTMAYLAYNRILDGTISTALAHEEQYCE